MTKASQLRAGLGGNLPTLAIGAHDGIGARLGSEAGFDAIWASGFEISASAAVPDANILTMTDFLAAAVEIDRATPLPVICDCDTGFGNAHNVMHLVRRYEAAGIAAVCIEDKVYPKINSFAAPDHPLVSIQEFTGKIRAAKAAQCSADFLVIGRIEALIAGLGEAEALRRAEAYMEAGADAVLIHSKSKTPDEVLSFLAHWNRRGPVAVVPTSFPQITAPELKRAGADLVIYANQGLRAATRAMTRVFRSIAQAQSTAGVEAELDPLPRIFDLQGLEAFRDEERFLPNAVRPVRAIVPVGPDLDPSPLALMDLDGRTLLERQLSALGRAGIHDVVVAASTGLETPCGARLVRTQNGGDALGCLRAALAEVGGGQDVLLCHQSTLFHPDALRHLLESDADASLLVGPLDAADPDGEKGALGLVQCEHRCAAPRRRLDLERRHFVQRIGRDLAPADAQFELVGLALLKPASVARLLEDRGPDPDASDGGSDGWLAAALGRLLAAGHCVAAVEERDGWLSIRDHASYLAAVAELKGD